LAGCTARSENTLKEAIPTAPGRAQSEAFEMEQFEDIELTVPLAWLIGAAKLPGRSLQASIAIFALSKILGSRTVPFTNLACSKFGINRNAKYRALNSLEKAGLILVKRKLGQAPTVTILHSESDANGTT